jgi:hypothetical protein
MVSELLAPVVTGAAAIICAGSAVGTYRRADQILDKIEHNETRSKRNREMLNGDPPMGPPLNDRVMDLEERNARLKRQVRQYIEGDEHGT